MKPVRNWTPTRFSKGQAFSLIELMVSIAIVASLAALFFPHLKIAKERSRRSVCINNLKNMGQAVAMYAADNQDAIPFWSPSGGSASASIYDASGSWPVNHGLLYLQGYLPKPETFFCPTANYYTIDGEFGSQNWGSGDVVSSYFWRNESGGGDQLTTYSSYGAHKALALDFNQLAFLGRYNHQMSSVNILFGDGHVAATADPNADSSSLGDPDMIFTWADDQS